MYSSTTNMKSCKHWKKEASGILKTAQVSKLRTLPTACSYGKDAFHKIKKQNQACAGKD